MKEYKTQLRKDIKAKRKAIPEEEKLEMDEKIHQKIYLTREYQRAKTVLCFVSLANEIDTKRFISTALKNGKKVAVPRCIDGTRLMDFYYIDSLDDLSSGSYGVLEPKEDEERKFIHGNRDDFMIVPCLSTDRNGYRLG